MSAFKGFRRGRLRRVRSIAIASVLVVVGLMWISAAQAVHDNGMFELEGNVVHDSQTTPPYDWTSLFGAGGTQLITPDPINGPVLASAFVDDTDAVDTSYFGGGTKIDDQVHNMTCGGPAANDKTSMDYVYASLIQVPANAPDNAGDQVLYFGIEKQAAGNGGDNAFGFWLFQNKNVGCDASVSKTFTGAHTDGDLFIDGLFTNGGGASDVEVFRWNGDDSTGSLGSSPIFTGNVCGAVAGNDDICGIANDATIAAGPWRSSPTMATNTFVEAGIDMTNLLGQNGGCFSTFLADSQASQSTNSQPKDYANGQFNTCVPPIIETTATPGGSSDSLGVDTEHDVATISAVGGRPDPTGSISFFLCNPSEVTAGGCESGGTPVGNAVPITAGSATSDDASGSLTNTVGTYCWRAEYTPDPDGSKFYVAASETNSDSECFTVIKASPQVSTVADPSSVVVNSDASASVSDTATFTDGFQLDGQSASFTLYSDASCSTATSVSGSATIGGGSATFTGDASGLDAGTYYWGVSYAGDDNNNSISECGGAEGVQNEVLTIEKASPQVSTVADPSSVVVGSDASASVSDTATFTDGFQLDGQSASFTLYSDASCSTATSVTGSATISGGAATFTGDASELSPGTYYWGVSYLGDANNDPISECGGAEGVQNEVLTIEKASPQVSTVADPSSVVVGSDASASVSDTATFTDGFQLDGQSASFTLYSDASCSTATSVTGSATISGGAATFTGDASELSPGTYYWSVSYLGDANNDPISECGGAEGVQNEVLTIGLNAPKVTTVADPSSAVVGSDALGSVSDTATFTDGFMLAGDNVDFTLYSDPSCDPADATSVAGTAEIAQDNTATFTGDASGLPAGTYYWGVSFLGDANNNPVSECGGDEGVQNEVLTIGPATPSASTTLKDAATNATIENGSTLPHGSSVYDTAQIGNTAGQPLTGTLSFRFFHNGDCSGTPASVQTGVAVGGHSAATGALDEGSYGFQAMYVAGNDPSHSDSAWSACEPFNIQGLVDLAVTKTGSPNPVAQGANITWTMVVTNNGPDADTGVMVSDPLPAGTAFVSVSVPSPASCTGGAIISCSLGTMTAGQSITITLVTTANVGPTITNTVHVVGDKPETNLANNTASASVVVQTKTPPQVFCVAVSKVTPKQLFVGRKTTLTIHVTKQQKAVKGIHVRIKGAKVNIKTKASNSKGVIKQTIKLKKAGVLVFTPIASKTCNTKRVGVTNVFTPPVTG
jgi:uncharacterized repeat protein (TIGR01451 family)